jgi:uncharacterized protein
MWLPACGRSRGWLDRTASGATGRAITGAAGSATCRRWPGCWRARITIIAAGTVFGFLITGSGFGSYATVHQALLLRSWYLFAVFGSAVAVAAVGLAVLRRAGATVHGGPLRLPHQPVRRRHIYGAAVFGAGFGLTGASPGGAVAMVATGGLGGLLVLAGLVAGLWLRGMTERMARPQHAAPGSGRSR